MITLLAAAAEFEAGLISQRTMAAMAAAKVREVKMGNQHLRAGTPGAMRGARAERTRLSKEHALDVLPYILAARATGAVSLRQVAAALTARGVQPPGGGSCPGIPARWAASSAPRASTEIQDPGLRNQSAPQPRGHAAEHDNRDRQDDEGEPLQVCHDRNPPSAACAMACKAPAAPSQKMSPIATECTVMLALL
jgi:hypothetical protein